MGAKRGFTIIELAVVVAIFLVILIALAPFVRIAKERKERIACANNLMAISLALHSYSSEHDGKFPATLKDLYPDYITAEKVFRCPAAKASQGSSRPGYVYTTGLTELSPPKEIIVQDTAGNHKRGSGYILRVNGSVEWVGGAGK